MRQAGRALARAEPQLAAASRSASSVATTVPVHPPEQSVRPGALPGDKSHTEKWLKARATPAADAERRARARAQAQRAECSRPRSRARARPWTGLRRWRPSRCTGATSRAAKEVRTSTNQRQPRAPHRSHLTQARIPTWATRWSTLCSMIPPSESRRLAPALQPLPSHALASACQGVPRRLQVLPQHILHGPPPLGETAARQRL